MSFYNFRVGNFQYELLPVDVEKEFILTSMWCGSLNSTDHAFSLQRHNVGCPLENNYIVTTLVGQECIDDITETPSEIFVSVSPCYGCVTDTIAETRALQYLNTAEYKKL